MPSANRRGGRTAEKENSRPEDQKLQANMDSRNTKKFMIPVDNKASPRIGASKPPNPISKSDGHKKSNRKENKKKQNSKKPQAEDGNGGTRHNEQPELKGEMDMRKRLWMYLLSNLYRAVDEIYNLCELEGDKELTEEAIKNLDSCGTHFRNLIATFEIQEEFGKEDNKQPIAWSVRKPSPQHRIPPPPLVVGSPVKTWAQKLFVRQGENAIETEMDLADEGVEEFELSPTEPVDDDCSAWITPGLREKKISWADVMDGEPSTSGFLSDSTARRLHDKLSSPERMRSTSSPELRKKHEEKQLRAHSNRRELENERKKKAQATSDKLKKVEVTQHLKRQSTATTLVDKLDKAEMKREEFLNNVIKKAESERMKVEEVEFINSLSTQNKRLSIEEKLQGSHERRTQHLEAVKKNLNEQLSKEEAARERRKLMEEEKEKRKKSLEQRLEESEQRRQEVMRERLSTTASAEKEEAARARRESLEHERLKKLKEKQMKREEARAALKVPGTTQEDSPGSPGKGKRVARTPASEECGKPVTPRHEASGAPVATPIREEGTIRKHCRACSLEITSEEYLQTHLGGKRHANAVASGKFERDADNVPINVIVDVSVEEAEADGQNGEEDAQKLRWRKKAKKIKARLAASVVPFEEPLNVPESTSKSRLNKTLHELARQMDKKTFEYEVVETALSELGRILEQCREADIAHTRRSRGLHSLVSLCSRQDQVSARLLCLATRSISFLTSDPVVCYMMLAQNMVAPLVRLLADRIKAPKSIDLPSEEAPLPTILLALINIVRYEPATPALAAIQEDIICYAISCGLVHRIRDKFCSVKISLSDYNKETPVIVFRAMSLLEAITLKLRPSPPRVGGEPSSLSSAADLLKIAMRETEHAGIISLLTCILLAGGPAHRPSSPRQIPSNVMAISTSALRALNHLALIDVQAVQEKIGSVFRVEFLHVAIYLITFCADRSIRSEENRELLHELIILIGYMCLQNPNNQELLQWGRAPTLLSKLCSLPFHYFSDNYYVNALFPTLITCCFNNPRNREILQQEVSVDMVNGFIDEHLSMLKNSDETDALQEEGEAKADTVPERYLLKNRFPVLSWQDAKIFFSISTVTSK